MKSRRDVRGAVVCLLASVTLGCGTAASKPAAAPGEMAMPEPTPAAAHVDTRACEPAGKAITVVARDAEGRPTKWRYFATHHGRRVLTCEAADANGDGRIDARYFYDASGRLVLEQRDLDFDGHAEIVADYSQFKPRRPLARAHRVQ
jgi:hypothetical protein